MSFKSLLLQLGKAAVREYLRSRSSSSSRSGRQAQPRAGLGRVLDSLLRGGSATDTVFDTTAAGVHDISAAQARQLRVRYAPNLDGDPDPGEVVWAWVPFAEGDGRGKDRPVLLLGVLPDGSFAGCYLTSQQRREYLELGTGAWDRQGRVSYLNPQRLLRVTAQQMRREGSAVSAAQFQRVVQQLRDAGKLPH